MPAILVVGPSRAGKSSLTSRLPDGLRALGLQVGVVNLDIELGEEHRSDGPRAIEIVQSLSREVPVSVVDCGAGQVAFSSEFRRFLLDHADAVVVVWCDEATFRARRSDESIEREIANNYGPAIDAVWDIGRTHGRLVDTSTRSIDVASTDLNEVIRRMLTSRQWIVHEQPA